MKRKTKKGNPVKKNMDKLHKPATHKDKKKESKLCGLHYSAVIIDDVYDVYDMWEDKWDKRMKISISVEIDTENVRDCTAIEELIEILKDFKNSTNYNDDDD